MTSPHTPRSNCSCRRGRECSGLDEAIFVLYSVLGEGRVAANEAKKAANAAGISDSTLKRAKAQMGIKSDREGFGPGSAFYWVLDEDNEAVRRHRRQDRERLADRPDGGDGTEEVAPDPSLNGQEERHTQGSRHVAPVERAEPGEVERQWISRNELAEGAIPGPCEQPADGRAPAREEEEMDGRLVPCGPKLRTRATLP